MSQGLTLEQVLKSGLGDATLVALVWKDDDLVVTFGLSYGDPWPERLSLRFARVSNLRVDIEFGEYVGSPLLFEAAFTNPSPNRWDVSLDFGAAPEGAITLLCTDILLEDADPSPKPEPPDR